MADIDLRGRTALVTGANSGIGLETARAFARMGARVLLGARRPDAGQLAVEDVRASTGRSEVELFVMDLADLADVRRAAKELHQRAHRIDILVNNAGLILTDRQKTKDGFEATFGINHLGPFLFTHHVLDLVRQAQGRIVNVASAAHRFAPTGLDMNDLMTERGYFDGFLVYAKSKLANILFTRELSRRLEGTGVTVNAVHPGTVRSGFAQDGDTRGVFTFGLALIRPFIIGPERGAKTPIYAATEPALEGITGKYFSRCRETQPNKAGRNDAQAAELYEASAELVNLEPPLRLPPAG